jgi:pyruvate dehydrogenase E1 component
LTQYKKDTDPQETQEWLESIDDALEEHGFDRARFLLEKLVEHAQAKGARLPFNTNTPFINTILPEDQPKYPGDRDIERTIKSIIRWNAMAMVVSNLVKRCGGCVCRNVPTNSRCFCVCFYNHGHCIPPDN